MGGARGEQSWTVQGGAAHARVLPGQSAPTSQRGSSCSSLASVCSWFFSHWNNFSVRKAIKGCNSDAGWSKAPSPPPPPAPFVIFALSFVILCSLPPLLLRSVFLPSFTVVASKEGNSRRRSCVFLLLPLLCLYLLTCSFPPPSHVSWAVSS